MGDISQSQFDRFDAILRDPEKVAQMAPEMLARVTADVRAYKAKAGALVDKLDPELPLLAQPLATQPGTNHPKGDIAAADDWERNPESTKGTVVVYDIPLQTARKKILEDPNILPMLGYKHGPPSAESIQSMGADSDIYQAYNDHVWRETADAATKAGKHVYRYAKAPWLQDGGVAAAISSLGMKLKTSALPALEGLSAYVMGVDDTAQFGAMRAAQEATDGGAEEPRPPKPEGDFYWHPTLGWTPGKMKASADEVVGGSLVTAAAEGGGAKLANELMEEEHPILHTLGQVQGAVPGLISGAVKGVGKLAGVASESTGKAITAAGRGLESLAPWSASNEAFDAVASGGRRVLSKLGLVEGLAPVAASALSAGIAGGAVHAAQEGVNAASNLYRTGETGTTLDEAAGRTLEAAKFAGAAGVLGSVVQQGSGQVADWVRGGNRYKRLPGQLGRAGVEVEFGKGFVEPAAVAAAKKEAEALDDVPVEAVLAERVAPKLSKATDDIQAEAHAGVKAENAEFQASPEGKAPMPLRNFIDTAVTKLRGAMEKRAKGAQVGRGDVPDPVGYKGQGREVKELFNQTIDEVSLKPTAGAIELSPEEAQAFLEPEHRVALRRAVRGNVARPKAAATEVRGNAAREAQPKPPAPAVPVSTPEHVPTVGATASEWAQTTRETKPAMRVTGPGRGGAKPAKKPAKKTVGSGRAPLSADLRAAGHDTVYVVPRQHDAEHTETLLKAIDGFREHNPKNVDLIELDQAVRKDRDLRPRGGEAGGWSKLKTEQHERLDVADEVKARVAPRGDANEAAVAYARGKAGAPRVRALRKAAEKAGVLPELRQTRVPALMERLANRTAPAHKAGSNTLFGAATSMGDAAMIRGAYPVLKSLEGPLGPLGTGKAGRLTVPRGPAPAPEDERTTKRKARYSAWREEYLDRRKPKHRRRRKP